MSVVRVGMCSRLAGPVRLVVGERDPERAAFAGIELMYVTRHAGRRHPSRHRTRIEQRAIDLRAGRVNAVGDTGRAHARTLACAGQGSVAIFLMDALSAPAPAPARPPMLG